MDIISELKKQINFVDLATMHGYETIPKKSTKKSLFMERGDDKILVYQHGTGNEDFYYTTCNNDRDKGDIFNFVVNKGFVQDLKQAIPYLKKLDPHSLNLSQEVIKKTSKVKEPFKAVDMHPIDQDNYLIRKRYIPLETLQSSLFKDSVFSGSKLYTDELVKSTIFPLKHEGKTVGQNVRNIGFEHLIENSDKTNGVWSSSTPAAAKGFAVFENPIDAISHYILTEKNYIYKATIGSPSRHVVENICKDAATSDKALILCGDHDKSGQHFNLNFLTQFISFVNSVDLFVSFNENANQYSLVLSGESSPGQRNLFDRLAKAVGSDVIKLSYENDKISLVTPYQVPALKKIQDLLIENFGLEKSVAVERSKGKDFNLDLEQNMKEKGGKKKLTLGLSL